MDADNAEPVATVTAIKAEDIGSEATALRDSINANLSRIGQLPDAATLAIPNGEVVRVADAFSVNGLKASLCVSPETFAELKYLIDKAGWDNLINDDGSLDLSGILVKRKAEPVQEQPRPKAAEIPEGFVVNGKEMSMPNGAVVMTYEAIRDYAGMTGNPSMIYKFSPHSSQYGLGGILAPGDAITVEPGTMFSVCHTGNA